VLIHAVFAKHGGVCSGGFIDDDGDVLTCAHCFETTPKKLFVKLSTGKVYLGIVTKLDKKRDLAIVHVVDLYVNSVPYFDIGPEVKIGQQVFAFGSPLAIQNTLSVGWVENTVGRYVLHSAFINPGNSGGPLVDSHGRLVGINEATVMINFLIPAQGLFIAIDGSEIRSFLAD
jgi:S1-C subfamily serine protease